MLLFLKYVYSLAQGNTVCGNMSGQHLYVPVDATAVVDPVRLFAFVGNSGAGYRSETSWTLRNRIQVRHSCTGYRSDTLDTGFMSDTKEQDTGQILRVRVT
jgi:hypothetical protein